MIRILLFVLVAQSVMAQDGGVVSAKSFAWPAYNDIPAWFQQRFKKDEYEELRSAKSWQLTEITYKSDGLKVNGFIFAPKDQGRKYPVIIYNRSGVGPEAAISKDNFRMVYEMYRCTQKGFIVVASQFRGTGGSEGNDEVGGADLNDVMNLHQVINELPYADASNIFMMGTSRGASMTLQAMKAGFSLRAAAVIGTPTDWEAQLKHNTDLGEKYWPDYKNRRREHIEERSAIYWPEAINSPVLFVHGTGDSAVGVEQVYSLLPLLQKHKKDYEVVIYSGDNHFITNHLDEKMDVILGWFNKYSTLEESKLLRDEDAIRAIFSDEERGYNENNADIILKHYSKDLLVTYPDTPDMKYQDFVDAYAKMMATSGGPRKNVKADIEEILIEGDLAFVRMNWNTTIYKDSESILRRARDLQVFRKEEGKWKFYRGLWFHEKPVKVDK